MAIIESIRKHLDVIHVIFILIIIKNSRSVKYSKLFVFCILHHNLSLLLAFLSLE
jgi:hypothetical protein